MCKISVVTSVYNCEQFIEETVRSVQNQTFRDWEYILLDDCSRDRSAEIIEKIAKEDARIKFIRNKVNQGQCKNLNKGISIAKGKYIARLDHDDILYPRRFEKQLSYMEQHPDIVLLGSWMDFWKDGKVFMHRGDNYTISSPAEAKLLMTATNFMAHSSFFIRKAAMVENDIWYDDTFKYAEDYAIVSGLMQVGGISLINEPLVTYRLFEEQLTNRCSDELKSGEHLAIQNSIADMIEKTGINGTDAYRKAIKGELRSVDEYKELRQFVIDYARQCGISDDERDIINNRDVQLTYLLLCVKQRTKGMGKLMYYARDKIRYRGWWRDRRGLAFAKHCLRGY